MYISEINLSETVKTWRSRIAASGKTEQQAATESGVSTGQLSNYLNEKNSPNIKKFEQFENYLREIGV